MSIQDLEAVPVSIQDLEAVPGLRELRALCGVKRFLRTKSRSGAAVLPNMGLLGDKDDAPVSVCTCVRRLCLSVLTPNRSTSFSWLRALTAGLPG